MQTIRYGALLLAAAFSSVAVAQEKTEAHRAKVLAERAFERTGNPYRVRELRFTFVVDVEGKEKVRRTHVFRPADDRLEVTIGKDTTTLEQLSQADLGIAARDPDKHRDVWARHAPGVPATRAAEAWKAFVNDGFWLWGPAKLFDRGVTLSSPIAIEVTATYGDVGVTPGDVYTYTVDEQGRVTSWAFTLASGRSGAFRWRDHRRFGPLELSLERVSIDGKTVIRFADVHVVER